MSMEEFLENLDLQNLQKSMLDNDSDYDDEVPLNMNPETESQPPKSVIE